MAKRRDPRQSNSILTPKGTQQYGGFRKKARPQTDPPEFPPKSGVISKELAEKLVSLAKQLGMSEFCVPVSAMGGKRKLTQLENALEEQRRRSASVRHK